MQTLKTCSRCSATQSLDAFYRRAKSPGGYAAACRTCVAAQHRLDYNGDPGQGEKQRARTARNRAARFATDPAYKRAFNLWGSTKRRSKIPPWVCILDFVDVCRKAIEKGADYEIDHEIPLRGKNVCGLHVPGNIRVVLKATNQAKGNRHIVI